MTWVFLCRFSPAAACTVGNGTAVEIQINKRVKERKKAMGMQCEQRGERRAEFLLKKLNSENVKNYLANEYLGTRIEIAYKIYTHTLTSALKPTECGAVLFFGCFSILCNKNSNKNELRLRTLYVLYKSSMHRIRTMKCFYHSPNFFVSFASIFYTRAFFSLFFHKRASSRIFADWCFASWQ